MAYSIPDILHMTACFAFILSGLICGVIRWFHMCHPYDMQADYFYPARKGVSLVFVGLALLFPYLLNVNDDDTWLYARSFGVLYYPAIYAGLILKYFNGKLRHWTVRNLLLVLPTVLLLGYLLLGSTSLYETAAFWPTYYIVGLWGIIQFVYLLNVLIWLKKQIDNYHYERYSTPMDFPYLFAERVLFTPLIIVVLMWIVYATGNRDVKMWVDWFMVVYNVVFLCVILHPQRKLMSESQNKVLDRMETVELELLKENTEQEYLADENDETKESSVTESFEDASQEEQTIEKQTKKNTQKATIKLTAEQIEKYKMMVIHEIRDNHAFLDSHYNLQKLADSINIGRTYTSQVCKALGGFYYLVNKYRLEYAEEYKRKHPDAIKEKVAVESGFTDRNAYRRALESTSSKYSDT